MVNIGENILEAIDIVANARIKNLSFDTSVVATITNNQDASIGKYLVQDANSVYAAYSKDTTYCKGDVVYITVPNGDYSQTKIISGKYIQSNEGGSEGYISPLNMFVPITQNLFARSSGQVNPIGLTANLPGAKEIKIATIEIPGASQTKIAEYDRLGIKASFMADFTEEIVSGTYGLKIIITGQGNEKDIAENIYLTTDQMIGNIYSFPGYLSQESLYEIKIGEFEKITQIDMYFIQNNDFLNSNGERFNPNVCTFIDAYNGEEEVANNENNNLFLDLDSLYIAFGYDLTYFDKNIFEIKGTQYKFNEKTETEKTYILSSKFLYKDHNSGSVLIFYDKNELKSKLNTSECEVKWYHFSQGAAAPDNYGGVNWELLSEKGSYVSEENDWETKDLAKLLNTEKEIEMFKAILVYKINFTEYVEYSDILTIYNANPMTADELNRRLNESGIVTLDGTDGIYPLYSLSNEIIDVANAVQQRELIPSLEGVQLAEGQYKVVWRIPKDNTMILHSYSSEIKGRYYVVTIDNLSGQIAGENIFNLKYSINSFLNEQYTNNTILCEIYLPNESVPYMSQLSMQFMRAGTQGTNYTIVTSFLNNSSNPNQVAPFLTIGSTEALTISSKVVDSKGKTVDGIQIYITLKSDKILEEDPKTQELKEVDILNLDNNKLTFNRIITSVDYYNTITVSAEVEGIKISSTYGIGLRTSETDTNIIGKDAVIYDSSSNLPYENTGRQIKVVSSDKSLNIFYKTKDGYTKVDSSTIPPYAKIYPCIYEGHLYPSSLWTTSLETSQLLIKDGTVDDEKQAISSISYPLLIEKNRYPSKIINEWDGKLKIDEENNSVMAAMVVAGKKEAVESGNTVFTGVAIGAIQGDAEKSLTESTGVFGFRQGTQAYAFKDDGTAFIGEEGRGRISFDGSQSIIASTNYLTYNQGMKIDLDDAFISMKAPPSSAVLSSFQTLIDLLRQDIEDVFNTLDTFCSKLKNVEVYKTKPDPLDPKKIQTWPDPLEKESKEQRIGSIESAIMVINANTVTTEKITMSSIESNPTILKIEKFEEVWNTYKDFFNSTKYYNQLKINYETPFSISTLPTQLKIYSNSNEYKKIGSEFGWVKLWHYTKDDTGLEKYSQVDYNKNVGYYGLSNLYYQTRDDKNQPKYQKVNLYKKEKDTSDNYIIITEELDDTQLLKTYLGRGIESYNIANDLADKKMFQAWKYIYDMKYNYLTKDTVDILLPDEFKSWTKWQKYLNDYFTANVQNLVKEIDSSIDVTQDNITQVELGLYKWPALNVFSSSTKFTTNGENFELLLDAHVPGANEWDTAKVLSIGSTNNSNFSVDWAGNTTISGSLIVKAPDKETNLLKVSPSGCELNVGYGGLSITSGGEFGFDANGQPNTMTDYMKNLSLEIDNTKLSIAASSAINGVYSTQVGTFDNAGLHIERKNSEGESTGLISILDETGLSVKDGSSNLVLIANNTGVQTNELEAQTFSIKDYVVVKSVPAANDADKQKKRIGVYWE